LILDKIGKFGAIIDLKKFVKNVIIRRI